MRASQVPSKQTQSRLIAQKIVELSSKVLSRKENAKYIALKVGDGPYSNVVTVRGSKDTVTFHIPSENLEEQAIAEGFSPEDRNAKRPFFKHKRYFHGLTLTDLQRHEPLFRSIVKNSMDYVSRHRPHGK